MISQSPLNEKKFRRERRVCTEGTLKRSSGKEEREGEEEERFEEFVV